METIKNNLIKAVDLQLGFAAHTITPEPLNFCLPVGNFTALIGTNGSGKTTLLNALLGEPVVQKGGIYLCEQTKPTHEQSATEISKWVSYVPQEHFYPGHLSVYTLLEIVTVDIAAILTVMDKMGISQLKDRILTSLSSGQRQRVFLARALLQNARVLLLDEPTNHLDPEGKAQFWKSLSEFKKNSNLDVFVCTHDLDFVQTYCSMVMGLKQGRLAFLGKSKDFFEPQNKSKVFSSV